MNLPSDNTRSSAASFTCGIVNTASPVPLNPGGSGGGEGGVSAFGGGGVCATTTETNVANTRVNAAAPGLDDPARRREDMTAFSAAPTPRRAPTPALRYDQCAS